MYAMVLEEVNLPLEDVIVPFCDAPQGENSSNQKVKASNNHMQDVLWSLLYGMGETRLEAAREIRRLTKTSARSRVYLAASGAITPLVGILKLTSVEAKEAALFALLNMAVRNERNKIRIVKAGAITPLVEILQSEDTSLRETAAAVVLTLSAATSNKPIIGASGAMPLLVEMLTSGSIQGKVDAVMALHHLSAYSGNVFPVLAAGASAPLILLLKDCKKSSKVAEKVIALLELMMGFEEGRHSVVKEVGGLLAIVEVLEEGSGPGRQHAVGALLMLCQSNRSKYREALLQEGIIPGLLELTVQGTTSAQEKARKLLELLRDSPPHVQRSTLETASSCAVLESIVYDIAAQVEDAEVGSETTKKMLSEMFHLSMEQNIQHLQQNVSVNAQSEVPLSKSATKVLSK